MQLVNNMNPWFSGVAEAAAQLVTFAIGVTDDREIPQNLPTFSKVNLRDHVRRLKMLGAEPSIARIRIT